MSPFEMCKRLAAVFSAASLRGASLEAAVLAVSGGPDSLALLLAAQAWRKAERSGRPPIRFYVATVDHRLRPQSAAEAAFVANLCRDFDLPHRTLVWAAPAPAGNLPEEARLARYDLLQTFARRCNAGLVLTAHHEDDQLETHVMRARRGGGPTGLAAMRLVREMTRGIVLARPFLDIPGARLKASVAACGLAAADDPTNRDPAYERVRVRSGFEAGTIDREAVRQAAGEAAEARARLETQLAAVLSEFAAHRILECREDGTIRLKRTALVELGGDLAFHLVRRALAAVSGASHWPEAAGVERILSRLRGIEAAVSATLGGAIVAADDTAEFCREFGRCGIAGQEVADDVTPLLFDGRFEIDVDRWRGSDARLVAFGSLGRGNRRERTLPVLLSAGRLLAVPRSLTRKAPEAAETLSLRSLAEWRLRRDLPR
ncbi:tRNA lysidine(34) synthetase TilS [Aurantimonas sp. VKM B-3413]|uniref:tRNA lysidine(34) synthetase TilS n=1 Tax=Aurantimonas sp. VKM B-3413 TaxID=2779401 RepID=UPI001E487866|nr:tRNA lysidine(34) synthetase TilS [Aurantimonas sp. VKM B-3413]MCB8839280.1 tRNA lysidine(34) synthetase TilS [Aurantimonas sp. VKM B-3413]